MIARTPSPTENKLILLRSIETLGPVTAQQLLRFMVENEIMDYIAMQLALAELADAALLRKLPHALGTLYALSIKGEDALRMFLKRIPHSRLHQIEAAAEAWRIQFRREKQVLSDWTQEENGEYVVRLRLVEGNATLLDCHINVPTREQAHQFCNAWITRASDVYGYIMRSLGEPLVSPSSEDTPPEA